MIFRQLFEPESSTCTTPFDCRQTGPAVLAEFQETMANLKLPYPRKMDEEVPEAMRRLCEPSLQGG